MRELRIFGMRRSGNHAIIEWIARHFDRTLHYNDCWGWDETKYTSKHLYGKEKSDIDLTIYSYEDFCPSLEEVQDPRCIVILRDWYNMMSSRLTTNRYLARHRHQKDLNNNKVLETWIEYAELYKNNKKKFILYNKWASDCSYRLVAEDRLGLTTVSDKFIRKFPSSEIGKRSSFDKEKIDLRMINSRYELLKKQNPDLYKKILKDDVVDYCKNIFGVEINES